MGRHKRTGDNHVTESRGLEKERQGRVFLPPFMRGDGSSTVSRELWKTMLMVRSTNTRRIRAPMLWRGRQNTAALLMSGKSGGWRRGDNARARVCFLLLHFGARVTLTRVRTRTVRGNVCACVSKQVPIR